ncbi:MAG: TIR domain-containing protein, partial [Phormidesmis sp. CAN_BIN44]|nr:TIR domain-containing protein [Phormidesmis sp. CAN_BIN44]
GYSVVIQAWDFRRGGNFVFDMQKAASEAERTIAVLSETYLNSEFTQPEWAAAFAQDPTGKHRKLIPIRVRECTLSGILATIVYVDLVGVNEAEAQELVQRSVLDGRTKPNQKPRFPGSAASGTNRTKPVYPPDIAAGPPRASEIFVGRDEDLETLHKQLQSRDTIAISSITGMGGIGKTELAAQYALQQRDMGTYPGGICWLKAREDIGLQIVSFAQTHLGLSIPKDLELAQKVARCWQDWEKKETLIVLDDVQQYDDIASVLPPQRSQFRVLLTTRSRFGFPVQNYEIKVLSEAASLELLRSLVPDGRVDQDLAIAKQVCEWLGYLPLGLDLVGRYLARKKGTSIAKLWERLQEKRLAAQALLKAEPGMTAPLGVTAAFELSWQELSGDAQRLAALLSLFALAEIPWSLVQGCLPEANEEELEDLRDEQLVNLSLLSYEREGMYQLHQLLREFFRTKISESECKPLKTALATVLIQVAKQIPQAPTLEVIASVTAAIPHLQEVAEELSKIESKADLFIQDDDDLGWAFTRIAWFYQGQGLYAEAEPWLRDCLAVVRSLLGE